MPDDVGLAALVLEAVVRLIGALWFVGAFVLLARLRRDAAIDGMISKLSKMAETFEADTPADTGAAKQKSEADKTVEAWMDRDERARRRWLFAQALLLMAAGLSMAAFHPAAAWLAAAIVGAQGVYFIWREWTARRAPSEEAAKDARPSRATDTAGWFSLFAAGLVWTAMLGGLMR